MNQSIMLHVIAAGIPVVALRRGRMWILTGEQVLVGLAGPEHVGGLAVDHVVAGQQLLLSHAQGNAADVLDEQHD